MAIADPIQSSMQSVLKLILSQTDLSAQAPVDTSRGRPQEMSAEGEVNAIEEASDSRRLTLRCFDGKVQRMEGLGGRAAGQNEQLMDLLRTILIMQEKEVGRQRDETEIGGG